MREMIRAVAAVAVALSVGCSSNANPPADAGTDAGTDAGPIDSGPYWSAPVTIDSSSDAGYELTFAVDPSGHPAIAYFRNSVVTQLQDGGAVPDGGILPDGGAAQIFGVNQDTLVVARETSAGVWTTEVVPAGNNGSPILSGHYGLGLAFDPTGNPAVAYLGGETRDVKSPPDERWHDFETGTPLPSDSMLAQKSASGWKVTTLGNASDSYVASGYKLDDQGGIIGLWSAIAIGGDGIVHVVQRDVHFASAEGDTDDSNLEYGQFNAGTKVFGELVTSRIGGNPGPCSAGSVGGTGSSLDGGGPMCLIHGGGTYSHMVLVNGEPAVAFAQAPDSIDDANGAWFVMRTGPATWTRTQVTATTGRPGHGPSLAYNPSGGFAIGILDADQGDLLVTTSLDGINWNLNTVEALGETGYHPAVAWGNAGLGILYAYCRSPIDPNTQCNATTQELRFRVPGLNGPSGVWNAPEHIDSSVPAATALIVDGNGDYVAVWRDPLLGVRASRRIP